MGFRRVREFNFSDTNEIGQGGYARVYAQSGRNGKKIAVKIDDPSIPDNEYINVFIKREANALLQFDHPNIIKSLGHGWCRPLDASGKPSDEDRMFLALENLMCFENAKIYVERSNDAVVAATYIVDNVASALAYIHDRGWVHADINGGNVLTDGNNVKLIDFAFARQESRLICFETFFWVAGTRAYMSLGRLLNNVPTKADDVYALGILLCDLLLGDIESQRFRRLSDLQLTAAVRAGFNEAQKDIDQKIESSNLPGKVEELMRRLIGLGDGKPFANCHEIREFIRQIELPSIA